MSSDPSLTADQATRTEFGRPESSMRLSTAKPTATSVACAASERKRSASLRIPFQRAIWLATPARLLYPLVRRQAASFLRDRLDVMVTLDRHRLGRGADHRIHPRVSRSAILPARTAPVRCCPSAGGWARATLFALLQESLGIAFDPAGGEIRFDNPRQPLFLKAVQLSGVSLSPACADVSFCRHSAKVAVSVLKRTGTSGSSPPSERLNERLTISS